MFWGRAVTLRFTEKSLMYVYWNIESVTINSVKDRYVHECQRNLCYNVYYFVLREDRPC